jgi:hypothetical protein
MMQSLKWTIASANMSSFIRSTMQGFKMWCMHETKRTLKSIGLSQDLPRLILVSNVHIPRLVSAAHLPWLMRFQSPCPWAREKSEQWSPGKSSCQVRVTYLTDTKMAHSTIRLAAQHRQNEDENRILYRSWEQGIRHFIVHSVHNHAEFLKVARYSFQFFGPSEPDMEVNRVRDGCVRLPSHCELNQGMSDAMDRSERFSCAARSEGCSSSDNFPVGSRSYV